VTMRMQGENGLISGEVGFWVYFDSGGTTLPGEFVAFKIRWERGAPWGANSIVEGT
jgi:hypothetical protein